MNTFLSRLDLLSNSLDGELSMIVSQKQSIVLMLQYIKREPLAVVWPKGISDIRKTLHFA